MKIETYIDSLVSYAMNTGLAEPEDHQLLVNRLLSNGLCLNRRLIGGLLVARLIICRLEVRRLLLNRSCGRYRNALQRKATLRAKRRHIIYGSSAIYTIRHLFDTSS